MSANDLTLDEIKAMAESIGLTRFTEAHLLQLQRVTNAKRAQHPALPVAHLTPADEPANVFNAADGIDANAPEST